MSEEIEGLINLHEYMKGVIDDFITEYCDREGAEDLPKDAKEQSCPTVSRAMMLMDLIKD